MNFCFVRYKKNDAETNAGDVSANVAALFCGVVWKAAGAPEEAAEEEEPATVAEGDDGGMAPDDAAEIEAQREKRGRFDDEWNAIGEVLSTIPLEPLAVNVATRPDDEDEAEQFVPRTTDEMANEVFQILNGTV